MTGEPRLLMAESLPCGCAEPGRGFITSKNELSILVFLLFARVREPLDVRGVTFGALDR